MLRKRGIYILILGLISVALLQPSFNADVQEQEERSHCNSLQYDQWDDDPDPTEGDVSVDPNVNGIVPNTRGEAPSGTSIKFDTEDQANIHLMENIITDGEMFRFKDKKLNLNDQFQASYWSNFMRSNARNIQAYESYVYVGYVTTGGASTHWTCFWLVVSEDDGDTWSDPLCIHNYTDCNGGFVEILIYQDKIFYLTSVDITGSSRDGVYIRFSSYMSWQELPSAQETRINTYGGISQTKMVGLDGKVLSIWKTDSPMKPRYRVYEGGEWSGEKEIPQIFDKISISALNMDNDEMISVFGVLSSGDVVMMRYTAGGGAWDSPVIIADDILNVRSISTSSGPDAIHIALTGGDKGVYYGWANLTHVTGLKYVSSYSNNELDMSRGDIVISCGGNDVWIAFENGDGNISLIGSYGFGEEFVPIHTFNEGSYHCPVMDDGQNYYIHINGGNLQVFKLEKCLQARFVTAPISPIGLSSWKDIGISYYGFEGYGGIFMRVMSGDGKSQYLPDHGFIDMNNMIPGIINGREYNHIYSFQGDWTTGYDLATPIVIEMEWKRAPTDMPVVYGIELNFSISLPYVDDPVSPEHVIELDGCIIVPGGISLIDTRTNGEVIIGPIFGGNWKPDHISITCSSVNDENHISAEVLAAALSPIPGFTREKSSKVTESNEKTFLKWGDKCPYDIPENIDRFYIKLIFMGNGSLLPVMNSLFLCRSSAPSIVNASVSDGSLLRGREGRISFQLWDREEDQMDLDLSVECMAPGANDWTYGLLSEPYWHGDKWSVNFLTDLQFDTGEYRFRGSASDSVGCTSCIYEESLSIHVVNNPPIPPMVAISPPHPKTHDPIEIKTVKLGLDLESITSDLTYNVRFLREGILYKEVLELDTPNYTFDDDVVMKGETWTVEVSTWDGENESGVISQDIHIENSHPYLKGISHKIDILEDSTVEYDLDDWFGDIDLDALYFHVETSKGIEARIHHGSIEITTIKDNIGKEHMMINISDGMATITETFEITILPENDPPFIYSPVTVVVKQDEWAFVELYAQDFIDGDDITVITDILERVSGLIEGGNFISYLNGSFRLLPSNDMVGGYNITVSFIDDDLIFYRYIVLEIMNVNDPPSVPVIEIIEGKGIFPSEEPIYLRGSSDDPDLIHGDCLTYVWTSDLQGFIGDEESITLYLNPGLHNIKLTVEDKEGESRTATVTVKVIPEEVERSDSMRNWMLYSIIGILSFIIGAAIAILVILIVLRKGRDVDDKNKEKTKKEEMRGAVPGIKDLKEALPPITQSPNQLPQSLPESSLTGRESTITSPQREGNSGNTRESKEVIV